MILDGAQLFALLPLLLLAAAVTLGMLAVSVRRHHRFTAQITILFQLAALAVTLYPHTTQMVTPLLVFDPYARLSIAIFLVVGIFTTQLVYGYIAGYSGNREELYLLLLMAVMGASVMCAARHGASLLLGLELMTLSLFGMIAYPVHNAVNRRPLEAAIKYLVLSAAASAGLLFGLALVYAGAGTLAFPELAGAIGRASPGDARLIILGNALIWSGVAFKLSLVPFHLWTADVYEGAPAPITGFMAAISKGAVAILMLRYIMYVPISGGLANALTVVAVATILVGNFLALLQNNLKRLLAYSSIAHSGYLLVPFIVAGPIAREAVLFYVVAYCVMTIATFGIVTLLSTPFEERDHDHLYDLRGLFWRRPYPAALMAPMMMSLAGVPMTVGFLAKFYVLAAGVEMRNWVLVGAIVLGSAISLYYYLRVIVTMFLVHPQRKRPEYKFNEFTIPTAIALTALFILLFALGTFPQFLLDWITPAVASM
jgi:NADH-quinone oxidoreductase subunit N